VTVRREQQIEVEKFVEREYSRNMERPKAWPVSMLGMDAPKDLDSNPEGHPFFPLKNFSLLTQRPLPFPPPLLLSRNYYNPAWTGLRRLKNVIILLEWTPDKGSLALISDSEHAAAATVSVRQEAAVERAHSLLAFHNQVDGGSGDSKLTRAGLANAVLAATGEAAGEELLDALILKFGNTDSSGGVSSKRLKESLSRAASGLSTADVTGLLSAWLRRRLFDVCCTSASMIHYLAQDRRLVPPRSPYTFHSQPLQQ